MKKYDTEEERRDALRKAHKKWVTAHPEKYTNIHRTACKKYYYINKKDVNNRCRRNNRQLKEKVIEEYGNKCACCGEERIEFLAIDHGKNDGNVHRKEIGIRAGAQFYQWLRRNNFPKDLGLQVLCYNCNHAKSIYGICPHQKGEKQ